MRTLLVAALVLLGGCRLLVIVESEAAVSKDIGSKYDDAYKWVQNYFPLDNDEEVPLLFRSGTRRTLFIRDGKTVPMRLSPPKKETIFTFIHVSDVQLRDERVKLGGSFLSRLLDQLVSTNEYGEDQERFDSSVYVSLIKAINGYQGKQEGQQHPLFVVHTGDSVHAGVLQELFEFLWITDKLELPWLQIVGNHDQTSFGTKIFDVQLKNPEFGYFPLPDKRLFIAMHGHTAQYTRYVFRPGIFMAPPVQSLHDPTYDNLGESFEYHGFDLEKMQAYYAYAEPSPAEDEGEDEPVKWWKEHAGDFKVRFLFLETTEVSKLDAGGFDPNGAQVRWIAQQIDAARKANEHVVAFGHHDFFGGFRKEDAGARMVAKTLAAYPRFLGYFCGHTHRQEMDIVSVGKDAFWQVIAPSVIEWPQAALLVNLVRLEDGQLAWDVTPFTDGWAARKPKEKLDPDAKKPKDRLRAQTLLAHASARRDYGQKAKQVESEPPYRLLIGGER